MHFLATTYWDMFFSLRKFLMRWPRVFSKNCFDRFEVISRRFINDTLLKSVFAGALHIKTK